MTHRIMKCAITSAYLALIWLTWRWFTGGLNWEFASACVALSGFWLVLTRLQMRTLFRTYFDTLSRLQVFIPSWIGIGLSGLAIFASDSLGLRLVAFLEFIFWGYIYFLYRRNRQKYMRQGHGPLPAGTWVNPPVEAIQPGDLILTSGRIASRFEESVGHGEVAVRLPDGSLSALSSYMAKGVVLNDLKWLAGKWLKNGDHYIVMRLAKPLTDEQIAQAYAVSSKMKAENELWRDTQNALRAKVVSWLPLPGSWKAWLTEKTRATGYDWPGLFIGNRASNHWTCIGACLELYQRMGIKTHKYGTGLLGLGTGFLDPIMPVRFLADPAFRLLKDKDRQAFESGKATS